jgi:hypothetical protein
MSRFIFRTALLACAVIPAALAFGAFFVDVPELAAANAALSQWVSFLLAAALLLGLWNIVRHHGLRVARWGEGWPYSLILLTAMSAVLVAGLAPGSAGLAEPSVDWAFRYVLSPLNATVFSLLAFFVASAAYRAFRLRNRESAVMLAAGIVVLLGQVPVGFQIWKDLPYLKDWLLQVPAVGALRGIALGVALGTIAAGLRVFLGQSRPYDLGPRK